MSGFSAMVRDPTGLIVGAIEGRAFALRERAAVVWGNIGILFMGFFAKVIITSFSTVGGNGNLYLSQYGGGVRDKPGQAGQAGTSWTSRDKLDKPGQVGTSRDKLDKWDK